MRTGLFIWLPVLTKAIVMMVSARVRVSGMDANGDYFSYKTTTKTITLVEIDIRLRIQNFSCGKWHHFVVVDVVVVVIIFERCCTYIHMHLNNKKSIFPTA